MKSIYWLLLNIFAILPLYSSPLELLPNVLTTDQEIADAVKELVEFPRAATYSGICDVVNFTLHIRNNNEVRAISYKKGCHWSFAYVIEKAIDDLPPIELDRELRDSRDCHDVDITIDFSALCNPIYRSLYTNIESFSNPVYDSEYGSRWLIVELLSDEDRLDLYNQGVKSLLVTLYIERDGAVANVTITTLDGQKIDPSKYKPLSRKWTPMMINGEPRRSIVFYRYNIRGKSMALLISYDPSWVLDYLYGDCDNKRKNYGNRDMRHIEPFYYEPYEYASYDYMDQSVYGFLIPCFSDSENTPKRGCSSLRLPPNIDCAHKFEISLFLDPLRPYRIGYFGDVKVEIAIDNFAIGERSDVESLIRDLHRTYAVTVGGSYFTYPDISIRKVMVMSIIIIFIR